MNTDKTILQSIADNQAQLKALRELFGKYFTFDYGINTKMTNESLGQITRANVEGLKRVDLAFKELENYKTVKPTEEKPMPAR